LINYSYLLLQEFYMLNKKILAASIAATFAFNAHSAAVDLDATTIVPAKYASETVAKATKTTKGSRTIVDATTNLSVDAKIGFGFTKSTSFYVRYDLTGAVFATAKASTDLDLGGSAGETVTLSQGGAEDTSFVIFEVVDSGAAVASTQVLTLANADLALTGTGSATIQVRVFANAPDAVNQTGSLVSKSGTVVTQAASIAVAFAPASPVADVANSFTDFVTGLTEGNLGSVKLTLATVLAADDGAPVIRADVIADATSTYVVTGDFSTALTAGKGAVSLDTGSNCTTSATAMVVNTGGTTATLTNTTPLANTVEMFLCLKPDPAVAIAATSAYSATLTAAAGTDGTLAPVTGALGSISRNGTTLEIPYMTTFADYNQRLIMTNNAATATTYSCAFTPEAGVTATVGTMGSGSIAANTTVVIKATDLVTLVGGTRTAARCTLLSQSTSIDAATTIVNLSDKSTDTYTIN
jgi:hypothetical protein